MPDTNLYDEWAQGVSLANHPSQNDNEFFQEIPTELNKPNDFVVAPENIPSNPVAPVPAAEVAPVISEEPNQEVISLENGGSITIEKTSRGWKATLDSSEQGVPSENFYGNNKTQLIANLAKGKLEASKAIRKLKREKLLGGDEPVPATHRPSINSPTTTNQLTADDVVEIKTKLSDNPIEALESWMKKRFGKDPDQFAQALSVAEEARNIVDAQRIKSEVDDVNGEFIRNNPDWADEYANDPENARKLIARMSKAYLNKRVTLNTPQTVVDGLIYELFSKGYWTAENLESAKEDLIEIGELHKPSVTHPVSQPTPQPVTTTSGPSVPEPPRIATPTGQPAVSLGLPAKNSTPVSAPEEKTLTDVDLQSMSLQDLRQIAAAQLEQMRRGRQ